MIHPVLKDISDALARYRPEALARPSRGDFDLSPTFVDDRPKDVVLKSAAVLVPLVDHVSHVNVLLTRRTDTLSRHAGQIAFPGGRIDATDADATAAALREAHEEIGLPPERVDVLGQIDCYETGTGYGVTPVVGRVPTGLTWQPQEAEVAEIFEVPLDHILDPANWQQHQREWLGRMRRYYVIEYGPHAIWGATAGMLVNFATVVKGSGTATDVVSPRHAALQEQSA